MNRIEKKIKQLKSEIDEIDLMMARFVDEIVFLNIQIEALIKYLEERGVLLQEDYNKHFREIIEKFKRALKEKKFPEVSKRLKDK